MILPALIFLPLLFAALVVVAPAQNARRIALIGSLIPVLPLLVALALFSWGNSAMDQYAVAVDWIPEIGLKFRLGVDAVSMLLIALTVLLGPICVAASFTAITTRVKTYYAWLLVLQAAMTGVFAAGDIILFYICFEFTLIPMWILIHLYGSTNRAKAATKFFLYTFTGSMIALAGIVYVVWHTWLARGEWTFDIASLSAFARTMTPAQQGWVLLALMAGFAVKVPLFPVHTWLPLAHTEAPTAGSVILAGVLLKLGTYGIFRFVLGFAPVAVYQYQELIAVLSIMGIVYAGLICWVQTDVKKLVAYSSVAHLGFCILGLIALNGPGITGSVLYMINHGLSTGALFLLIGMIYERYHTRSMKELGGLASVMPVWSTFMIFFIMASVGLPGLNGFVSEFLCLLGTFQADSDWARQPGGAAAATFGKLGFCYALVAGTGMIIAAMYLLYMAGRIVWGPLTLPAGHEPHGHGHASAGGHGEGEHESPLPRDLSTREIGVLLPLAAGCIILGVYPKPVLDALHPPIQAVTNMVRHEATAAFPDEVRAPTPRLDVAPEEDGHTPGEHEGHNHGEEGH